ncbi:MAG TPA: hypothetical protein VK731_06815 [Candidatus Cybelea sp.]|nr:hypothetical protein [Candidatus Cybelea sp.]
MANVGFFIRRRLRFFRGLLLAVFLVVFGGRVGNATLILYVYHNGEIYAGADSLVTQTGGTNVLRINKIIPVTDTCNASIANSYGGFVISKIDGQTNLVFFPDELQKICLRIGPTKEAQQTKIEQVASNFSAIFTGYYRIHGPQNGLMTRLCFAGYDPAKKDFFLTSYLFIDTNMPTCERIWEIEPGDRIGKYEAVGQEAFIGSLFIPTSPLEDKLATFRTDAFKNVRSRIDAGASVSQEEVRDWMLGIFDLDEMMAIPLRLDDRPISGPYRIFKIGAEKIIAVQ